MSSSRSQSCSRRASRLALSLSLLAASGCAGLGFPPTPSEPPLTRCSNPQGRYSISYPSAWHTNTGGPVEPCRFFHPSPFEVEPHTEEPSVAISVKREEIPLERFLESGYHGYQVLLREPLTLAGHPALRFELLATQEAPLSEPGLREYLYVVRAGPDSFIRASTLDLQGLDYPHNKDVLDRMVRTLELP